MERTVVPKNPSWSPSTSGKVSENHFAPLQGVVADHSSPWTEMPTLDPEVAGRMAEGIGRSLLTPPESLGESGTKPSQTREISLVPRFFQPRHPPQPPPSASTHSQGGMVQRLCEACQSELSEEKEKKEIHTKLINRQESSSLSPVPNYQLTPPSLLRPPDPSSRYRLGADLRLNLSPQIQAMILQQVQQQLNPTIIQQRISQINLKLPSEGFPSSTVPNPPTTPPPSSPSSPLPAQTKEEPPRPATVGDVLEAILAIPDVDSRVKSLQTQVSDRLIRDWNRLSTGEQIGLVSTEVIIGGAALTGIFSNPTSRQFALNFLNEKTLPVPGLNWLHLEINTGDSNLMLGFHVDIGRLLPSRLGFGPSSPNALGGPRQPEPPPVQRMVQRLNRNGEGDNFQADSSLEHQLNGSKGGGSPLYHGVQDFMESRFGADFSRVRVHTDRAAVQMNHQLKAQAFTHGNDIYFGEGKSPGNNELTAHELTHVVQQTGGLRLNKVSSHQTLVTPEDETTPPLTRKTLPNLQGVTAQNRLQPPQLENEHRSEDHRTTPWQQSKEISGEQPFNLLPVLANPMLRQPKVLDGIPLASNLVSPAWEPSSLTPSPKIIQRDGEDDGGLLGGLRGTLNRIIEGLRSGWGSLKEMAEGAFEGLQSQFGSIAQGLGSFITNALSGLQNSWTSLKEMAGQLTNGIQQQVQGAMGTITGAFDSIGQAIKDMDAAALKAAFGHITGLVGGVFRQLQQSGQAVFERISNFWNGLQGRFGEVFKSLNDRASEIFSRLQSAAEGVRQRLTSFWSVLQSQASRMSGVLGGILERLRSLVERLLSWGQEIWNGIQQQWTALRGRLDGLLQQARQQITQVWQGLQRQATQMWQQVQRLWARLQTTVKQKVQAFIGPVKSIWEKIRQLDISQVIHAFERYVAPIRAAYEAAQNPDKFLQPMAQAIASKLEGIVPESALQGVLSQHIPGGGKQQTTNPTQSNTLIQRQPDPSATQTNQVNPPLTFDALMTGAIGVAKDKWKKFNFLSDIWKMLKEILYFWESIPQQWHEMTAEISKVWDRMKTGIGYWRHILDIPLIILRHFNNIAGILAVWGTVIATLVGAFAGAFGGTAIIGFFSGGTAAPLGGTAGFLAGAGLGLGWATKISMPLVAVFVATEVASLAKAFVELWTLEQTKEEQVEDLEQVVGSSIALVIAGGLILLGAIASKLGGGFKLLSKLLGKENATKFIEGFESGLKRGKGKPTEIPEDPNNPRKTKDLTPDEIKSSLEKAHELAQDPNNVRPVDDPASLYDAEIDLGNGRKYRRQKGSDDIWCINPCERNTSEKLKKAADEAAKSAITTKKSKLFNQAKEINKRAKNLGKKFGKEADPELNKIQEEGDEISIKVDKTEANKLDDFERTLNENNKKLDELEKKFAEEFNLRVQKLQDSARDQKNRTYRVAEKAGDQYNSELSKIATNAESIENELKLRTPDPKTLAEYESTLNKNNRDLREIEGKLGIASFKYVEEFEPGRYRLKQEYVEKWREQFYPSQYDEATYDEIERLETEPYPKGWKNPNEPDEIWDEVQKKFVDARLDENTITVDHKPIEVVRHWNEHQGNNMGQEGRRQFYRDPSNHKLVLKRYNKSPELRGTFNPEVGPNFRGPGGEQ